MNNQKSLIDFDKVRSGFKLFNGEWIKPVDPIVVIPPSYSDSFYVVGNGTIGLYVVDDDPDTYQFDLSIDDGSVDVGLGSFQISKRLTSLLSHYRSLLVKEDSKLTINNNLTLTDGNMIVNGHLNIESLASLILREHSEVTFSATSELTINDESFILMDDTSKIYIYGTIYVHINKIQTILNQPSIYIDPSASIKINGLRESIREYSLTDFINEMNSEVININTVKEKNYNNNQLRCKWEDGSPVTNNHTISIICEIGNIIAGDLKKSFLGLFNDLGQNQRTICDLIVNKYATLIVSETYQDYQYYYPSLYIGQKIDNCKRPAQLVVNGKLIVDGENCCIYLDRGGSMTINGEVQLLNKSSIQLTEYDQVAIQINGKLIIDSLDQLIGFSKQNISFGKDGKLIILNKYNDNDKVILSLPNGIETSKLYNLFKERLEFIEFHLPNNCGIKIDQDFENFKRQMKYWYGNYTLDEAIKNKLIVWADNAFIELNHEVLNWIDLGSNLYSITRLFQTSGESAREELQSIVDKFILAKSGNIRFKFMEDPSVKEIIMILKIPKINSVYYDNRNNDYVIQVDSLGYLFMCNNVSKIKSNYIIENNKQIKSLLSEYNHFIID